MGMPVPVAVTQPIRTKQEDLYDLAKEVREAYRTRRPALCPRDGPNACTAISGHSAACLLATEVLGQKLVDFLCEIVGQATNTLT
jgi:hypothetical protein